MFFSAFTRVFRRQPSPPVPVAGLLGNLDRVETFPTLSDTAARAMAVMNDPNAALTDLVDLIRRDGVLAAAVLKLSNSAAYRGRYPTDTVAKAATKLGMRGCQQVVAAVGMRGVFKSRVPAAEAACEALLRHALFTATLATRLNAAGGIGFRGEEFTAGLLHDIGRVILCVRAPAAFPHIDPLTFREDAETLAHERAVAGTDHCEIGTRFARANALPRPVVCAIGHHHDPGAEKEYPLLVALTATADALANHVQRERKLTNFRPDLCSGFFHLRHVLGPDVVGDVRKALTSAVVDALRETRAMLRVTAA
ncbi:HDOD domain-containing protein [Frigoriglobus tundricola]|uniref:HDOD domain-containing protein n=1 Tax=Frigoriglobus tundricola TaxID=2774151 RepID=A0A6M5YNY3_9BACT|nr:HDOD domain-containing protein [Frigoriglobus tundricola]QJW94993.1 hypothetical protein FTUN_2519 [Frigoriglobus tundricola]